MNRDGVYGYTRFCGVWLGFRGFWWVGFGAVGLVGFGRGGVVGGWLGGLRVYGAKKRLCVGVLVGIWGGLGFGGKFAPGIV